MKSPEKEGVLGVEKKSKKPKKKEKKTKEREREEGQEGERAPDRMATDWRSARVPGIPCLCQKSFSCGFRVRT